MNSHKKTLLLVLLVSTLFSCTIIGTTVLYTFQDKTMPLEEHCRLYVRHELLVEQFDEHKDTIIRPLGFGSGSLNAAVNIIPAGEHSFLVSYRGVQNQGARNVKQKKTEYTYTLNDGKLVLFKNGKPIDTFAKL
jgi:hypothetical protein